MKHFLIALCSLTIVAADVSHLFANYNRLDDHHNDHHHEHDHNHDHHHHHEGYSYEPPSIPFELPKPVATSYLPPQEYIPPVLKTTTTRRPLPPPQEYLPPVVTTKRPLLPSQEYLPPVTTTKRPLPPPAQEYLPPVTTTKRPLALPAQVYLPPVMTTKRPTQPPTPKVEYLPPTQVQKYQIPIPIYAEILETNYLPPIHEDVNENLRDDGYHYQIPLKPFFY